MRGGGGFGLLFSSSLLFSFLFIYLFIIFFIIFWDGPGPGCCQADLQFFHDAIPVKVGILNETKCCIICLGRKNKNNKKKHSLEEAKKKKKN